MADYKVRLVNEAIALDQTILVSVDQYILAQAEISGIRLPAGCRQGDCSAAYS